MLLRIFTEPQQGATYDQLLAVALESERLGFDAFFRSDHYVHMGAVSGLPGSTDAWVTLAGLARETERIRLGTLVSPATFRNPGPLAISVAQVDQMSGGRVEFGFGAGWFEREHAAYGLPFPPLGERFDRFAEQLEVIVGLWDTPTGASYTFSGRYYELTDSPALPKPLQRPHPPVIIGGGGKTRTPALAARYANEFNLAFRSVEDTAAQFDRVRRACGIAGRDPSTMVFSAAQIVCLGESQREIEHRAERIGRDPEELRVNGLAGGVSEVVDKIATFARQGAARLYLQVLDLEDLDHLRLIAERVMPQLA